MRTGKPPAYQRVKDRDLAMVKIAGKRIYLGKYGSPESHEKYHRTLAEWRVGHPPGEKRVRKVELTIRQLVDRFIRERVTPYYVQDGKPTGEQINIHHALVPLTDLYASFRVTNFGPRELIIVRDEFAYRGQARSTANRNTGRVRFLFRWAVSQGLYGAEQLAALEAVEGLKRGRSTARETEAIGPVDADHLLATLPYLKEKIRTIVDLLLLTAARPGEICKLRPVDIDKSLDPWIYRPTTHKTSWRGKKKSILFGPKAQSILSLWIDSCPINCFIFAPLDKKGHQLEPTKSKPYSVAVLRNEITKACRKADVPPWHPNQLRHSAATAIRAKFGLEAAQLILGHSQAKTTEIYAERDQVKAAAIIREIG